MSVLQAKRSFDTFSQHDVKMANCTPHRISFLTSPNKPSQPQQHNKRFRSAVETKTRSNQNQSLKRRSPYTPSTSSNEVADKMMDYVMEVKAKKRKLRNKPPKTTFTEEQVRKIVAEALTHQEGEIRLEFQAILNQQLSEQFQQFSQFNQDYISRQFASKGYCDYVS